ncbi:MAG: polyphosphate polymerase domain-containing protein [Melioribacteraceae bacterium]|nr:polyphosphate polymerase domain-containing protein [Melioribacteraceae bacterium]MCF8353222.1 polyphosphate polymerase domain-containing protein [Melioribacteraceae bacterium]MCF8395613.1 polyphosphate polymerase domain-containing protein [Melioribacteraceae bacterium]MCF8418744.1 polyphosphate polymerase domain-containing protein [Melioribacteraceae bacterium]
MRYEYKFLLSNSILPSFMEDLNMYVLPDKYAEDRPNYEYTVRSIYFDTINLEAYHDKLAGIKVRKKFRIRGYNNLDNESICFLEIKRKYESRTWKNRSKLQYKDLGNLIIDKNLEQVFVNIDGNIHAINAERFLHNISKRNLMPTVLVVYDRIPLFTKFNTLCRITIDKNLRYQAFPRLASLFDNSKLSPALRNRSILEVKFEKGFPGWLIRIIQKYQLQRMALSKYTICLDAERKLKPWQRKSALPFKTPLPIDFSDYNGDKIN